MELYHQLGHNYKWNIDSQEDHGIGNGYIMSPINLPYDKINSKFNSVQRRLSFFDPQFYIPGDSAKKLKTYPFFPNNKLDLYSTKDFKEIANEIAHECLEFQFEQGFRYGVIPARYYEHLPDNVLLRCEEEYVVPFINANNAIGNSTPLLLTVIVKEIQLTNDSFRNELLSWITNFSEITGAYLIFDYTSQNKQIVDAEILALQMLFIQILRENGLEVRIGYSNLELLLHSLVDATSVTLGSFENLRSFQKMRFESIQPDNRRGPTPRIYSSKLIQWVPNTVLPPMRRLVPDWESYFHESPYKEFLLNTPPPVPPKKTALSFQNGELYKHYFIGMQSQILKMPQGYDARKKHILDRIEEAKQYFREIIQSQVTLDDNANDFHLTAWQNAIPIFESF